MAKFRGNPVAECFADEALDDHDAVREQRSCDLVSARITVETGNVGAHARDSRRARRAGC
ncbi:MAG: hypothetical protein IPP16_09500 [Acidimicrobiaceae bacterium]|nr:hypothetical protein [Acidimicrobiaceae bacterium]